VSYVKSVQFRTAFGIVERRAWLSMPWKGAEHALDREARGSGTWRRCAIGARKGFQGR
jgi:hypothetical protein